MMVAKRNKKVLLLLAGLLVDANQPSTCIIFPFAFALLIKEHFRDYTTTLFCVHHNQSVAGIIIGNYPLLRAAKLSLVAKK